MGRETDFDYLIFFFEFKHEFLEQNFLAYVY
ncbi:hypothetical protein BC781_10494 [Sediminitomix flava]|uniref:Uncharacterized protein n=1 Tax=Sediminitomix flava TaxID=379075 RepID=A0A315Z8F0_SEDFL|nr:hypothetical protein BC781_10494 [Sediminitomix flava]